MGFLFITGMTGKVSMKTQLFFSGSPVADFKALVESYKASELSSPLRSTVPLQVFWKDLHQRIALFFQYFNLNLPDTMKVCFEYSVPVQSGKGNPSYTDLMLTSAEQALAIEAKYTEPQYDSVKKWLGEQPAENKVQVLKGWLGLIENGTGKRLHSDDVVEITYQMIHRTASACYPKVKQRFVVYQCFALDGSMKSYYKEQLSKFSGLLGSPDNLGLFLVNHPVIKSHEYKQLEALWHSGKRHLELQVKKGLIDGKLLEFGDPDIIKC
jgi:hypothetical protein